MSPENMLGGKKPDTEGYTLHDSNDMRSPEEANLSRRKVAAKELRVAAKGQRVSFEDHIHFYSSHKLSQM